MKVNFPQDYAQSMVLAKLEAGCPLDRSHRCPKCDKAKNREAKKLFKATWRIVKYEGSTEKLIQREYKQQRHRDFLEVRRRYGTKRTMTWYAKQFDVSTETIKKWLDVERPRRARVTKG
jgi:hypothetical protein